MSTGFDIALLTFGVILLLLGLIGQVKAKGIEAGTKNPLVRLIVAILGALFISLSLIPSGILVQLRELIPQVSSGSQNYRPEGNLRDGYAVVISSVKTKEDAHREGGRAKSKGFKYKIFRSENGFFAVAIGWHLELKDAQALEALAKQSGFDPYLHNFRTGTKWYDE